MADLGSIANDGVLIASTIQAKARFISKLVCLEANNFVLGEISTTEGNPAPSLKVKSFGTKRFRWTVAAGTRSLTVAVKQQINLDPRPRITILANPLIGVNSDTSSSAASSTGWVTIGPLTITPTTSGAVWVLFEALYQGQDCPTYWDNAIRT